MFSTFLAWLEQAIDFPNMIGGGLFGGIVIYAGYYKKKFAEYGKVDAQLQNLDKLTAIESDLADVKAKSDISARYDQRALLAEIEKVVAQSKNSNEFTYWRRKDDLDKLERFVLTLEGATQCAIDLNKYVNDTILKLRVELVKRAYHQADDESFQQMKRTLLSEEVDLFNANEPNMADVTKASALYAISYKDHSCHEFNRSFNTWMQLVLLNIEDSRRTWSNVHTCFEETELLSIIEQLAVLNDQFLKKVGVDGIQRTLSKADNDVFQVISLLADHIRTREF